MPNIDGKKFPYTPSGKAAAKAALKKMVGKKKKDGAGGPGFKKLQKTMLDTALDPVNVLLKDNQLQKHIRRQTPGESVEEVQKLLDWQKNNQLPKELRAPDMLQKKFKGKPKSKYPQPTPRRGWADYA